MPIFQLKRGSLFKNMIDKLGPGVGPHNPRDHFDTGMRENCEDTFGNFCSRNKSKATQGFVLSILCFVLTWKYPISSVWMESSVAFQAFGFRWILWHKKFMPVVPQSATGDVTKWTPERTKRLREDAMQRAIAFEEAGGKPSLHSPFWGAFFKWKAEGMPVAWNAKTGRDRAAATLDKIKKEKENSCSSKSQ
jgi:hypothetical protein